MRVRLLPAACAAALLAACQPFGWESFQLERYRMDTDHVTARRQRDTTATPGGEEEEPVRTETAVYVSAVVFPQGYDWVRDTSYSRVDKTLVLLRNGVRILSLPAGPGTEIGTDPDMHRILDGHLYSDYSTATETVIRRDGAELFRIAGREHFLSFQLWDGRVHTLGRNRDGHGFAYRVDGKAVYAGRRGTPVGALHRDGERVCFAYDDGSLHFVTDGQEEAVPLPAGSVSLYDIRRVGGALQAVFRSSDASGQPLIRIDAQPMAYAFPSYVRSVSRCRLAAVTDRVRLAVSYEGLFGHQDALWGGGGSADWLFFDGRKIYDYYFSGADSGYIGTGEGRVFIRPPGGEETVLDGHYRFLSGRCAWQEGSRLYAVLTGVDGTESVLWHDGEAEKLPLWGYLTGVSVREEVVASSQ